MEWIVKMSEYSLKKSSLYNIRVVKDLPIVIFDEHNMALPVWGTYSSRMGRSLNLVTFDTHTDTHPPFNAYLCEKNITRELGASVLLMPTVKQLLQDCRISLEDFSFEDIYKLSCSYVKNSEQILTAYAMEYLESYTVIHRDSAYGYERDDRLNGLNARYICASNFSNKDLESVCMPIALDFDLDYFRSESDMDKEFFEKIKSLIKNASVITIAREPKYFEFCKTDKNFCVSEAEEKLVYNIVNILNS